MQGIVADRGDRAHSSQERMPGPYLPVADSLPVTPYTVDRMQRVRFRQLAENGAVIVASGAAGLCVGAMAGLPMGTLLHVVRQTPDFLLDETLHGRKAHRAGEKDLSDDIRLGMQTMSVVGAALGLVAPALGWRPLRPAAFVYGTALFAGVGYVTFSCLGTALGLAIYFILPDALRPAAGPSSIVAVTAPLLGVAMGLFGVAVGVHAYRDPTVLGD